MVNWTVRFRCVDGKHFTFSGVQTSGWTQDRWTTCGCGRRTRSNSQRMATKTARSVFLAYDVLGINGCICLGGGLGSTRRGGPPGGKRAGGGGGDDRRRSTSRDRKRRSRSRGKKQHLSVRREVFFLYCRSPTQSQSRA